MKLFYSKTSPYSRKVYILAKSLGMGGEIELIYDNPLEDSAALLAANPLAKVPALITDEKTIFDSPLIADHFLRLAGQGGRDDAYFEALTIQALADGMMDAAVALRMESVRPEAQQSPMWQKRWYAAIDRGLGMLEATVIKDLKGWKLDSISVACMLDYLCFRLPEIDWQTARPETALWFEGASARMDMKNTDPRL